MIVLGGLEYLYYSIVGGIAMFVTSAFLDDPYPDSDSCDGYITEDDIRTEVYSSDEN